MATVNKISATPVPNGPLIKKKGEFKGSTLKAGGKIKKAQAGTSVDSLANSASNELDKKVAAKKAAGVKEFTPQQKVDYQKSKSSIGAPPPGFKPKMKAGGKVKKNWIQGAAASIKRRGTEGKCTPITKPGCSGRAKALAKTFKAIARKRKAK